MYWYYAKEKNKPKKLKLQERHSYPFIGRKFDLNLLKMKEKGVSKH